MSMLALLRQAGPRMLWAGQVASVTGDRLYAVALVWLTVRLTGSPTAVGVVSLATTVPLLVTSLVCGSVADTRDGLRLAKGVDLARAVVVAVIPVLYLTGQLRWVALVAVAAGLACLEAFFLPGVQASLPRLVDRAWLTPMVSLLDSTDRLGRVLGPGLVGILVLVIPEVQLFTLDAVSFAVSFWCLNRLCRLARPAPPPARQRQGGFALVAGGWRVLWRNPLLRHSVMLRFACNLAWPAFTIGAPFLVTDRYHLGIWAYGAMLGVFGAGNLVGNMLAGRLPQTGLLPWCGYAWGVAGSGLFAMGLAPTYGLLLTACAGAGVCTPLANVTIDAYIARTVPPDLLARTYAAIRFMVVAAGAAGTPIAATLIGQTSAATTLSTAGAFITLAAVVVLISAAKARPAHRRTSASTAWSTDADQIVVVPKE